MNDDNLFSLETSFSSVITQDAVGIMGCFCIHSLTMALSEIVQISRHHAQSTCIFCHPYAAPHPTNKFEDTMFQVKAGLSLIINLNTSNTPMSLMKYFMPSHSQCLVD